MVVPEEKKLKAKNMLMEFVNSKKSTVHKMEKLAGYLNFLNKAIIPGRAFTTHMYAKFTNLVDTKCLRQHHHVTIDSEFKDDCRMWLRFLSSEYGYSVYRPFIDLSTESSTTILNFYTDVSGSFKNGGYGCVFNERWFNGKWDDRLMKLNPSIEFLEMAALLMGIFTWIDSRVSVFCDNTSIRDMLNSTTLGCKRCMRLVRIFVLKCIEYNTKISVLYVKSKDNEIADALSRNQVSRFKTLSVKYGLNEVPDENTSNLEDLDKIWKLDNY